MIQITESDLETLAALAGTLKTQHERVVESIAQLHTVRAYLDGAQGILNNIAARAEERARSAGESDPATMPRRLKRPEERT